MLGLRRYQRTQIDIWQGDITLFAADAIVTAANSELAGGGGVDAAIHAAGGDSILQECKKLGRCDPGACVVTTAGKLPANHLIHAVGPVWSGGDREEIQTLSRCYQSILATVLKLGSRHVSIPAISTGSYGFPSAMAAEIAMSATKTFLDNNSVHTLRRITFVAFDGPSYRNLQEQLFARFPDEIDDFED